MIDDLITGGSSIVEIVHFLAEHDIKVHDALVLVDREMGAHARLKQSGINLISIIKLDVMMNFYHEEGIHRRRAIRALYRVRPRQSRSRVGRGFARRSRGSRNYLFGSRLGAWLWLDRLRQDRDPKQSI